MSLRVGLFRLGQTLPRRHSRHLPLDTRLLVPSTRSITLVHDNEAPGSRFRSYRDSLRSSPQQLDVIHQYYPALAWEVSQSSSSNDEIDGTRVQDIISRHNFEVMLEALAASGDLNDLKRVDEILSDMTTLFQVPPDKQTHSAIIRGLIQRRNLQTVQRWFQHMPRRAGNVAPALEHYHLLLEACPEFFPSVKAMRSCVHAMSQSGCLPTIETYKILIRGVWKLTPTKAPQPVAVTVILNEMRDVGLAYDSEFLEFLQNLYLNAGLPRYAQDIETAYKTVYASDLTQEKLLESRWIAQLSSPHHKLRDRLQAYSEYVEQGGSPSPSILSALLQHSIRIVELEVISSALEMKPTVHHWSILIVNNIRVDNIEDALAIYREAIAAGTKPEASLVGPILKEIFTSGSLPRQSVVDSGFQVYNEFVTESSELSPENVAVHEMMLRVLANLSDNEEYSQITQSIIEKLQERNVPLHDMVSSMIAPKMNQASDIREAMKVYKTYKTGLDAKGYENVLEAFCRMCLQTALVPPLPTYFSIVKDMKNAGFSATSTVYTILLRALGQIGTLSHRKAEYFTLSNKCITATRRVHDLITLESSIVPDAVLWNQLMDTYLRLNCFADMLRVWDQTYISRQFDNISVCVVFDACRLTRSPHLIKQTYERLARDNFTFSLSNWNSYIEALCSIGNVNDALKTLCMEMGSKGVKPTVDTANLILDVVKKPHHRDEVLKRIKQFQPELYDRLMVLGGS